jgi:hypothetical protein
MAETQVVQLQCPNCGAPYQAPVRTVIDVGQEPRLREALLSGTVNQTVCPNCKQGGVLEVPLVYHDPAAEFLAVYFPSQLQIPEIERQRMIGELTQGLMRSLPAEQRKGYFFSPRQFVSRQTLMDAILGTMGISQEELDRQRKKMAFMEKLVVMADDVKGLEMLTKGQDATLDHEFFMILASRLSQAEALGDEKTSGKLTLLRNNLMPITTYGRRLVRQQAAVESLREVETPEELMDLVTAADLDEATAMAVAARPLLDYAFFEKLTARAEAAEGDEKARLLALRAHLSEVTQTLDDATRARMKEASDLLRSILEAPNPRSAVRDNIQLIDEVFLSVLSLNLQEAERRGAKDAVEILSMVFDEINAVAEEGLPPEMRLINDLLGASYPEETRALLHERQADITPEFLALLDELAKSLAAREDQDEDEMQEALETAKRLRDIRGQATLLA